MIKDDKVKVTAIISKITMRKLKEQANYEDRSVSNLINKIIKEYYQIRDEE